MRGKGTKLGEVERDFREYYVRDFNVILVPNSVFLRSGLLRLGKVCGAIKM